MSLQELTSFPQPLVGQFMMKLQRIDGNPRYVRTSIV